MTALIRLIVRQRAGVILLAIILLIAGFITALRLPLELFPNVSFNTVTIVTAYPGAAPDTVLNDVTKPVEAAVAGVPGINTLLSTSAENASIVTVQFNYGTDINQAESKIATAVNGVAFPSGVQAPKVSTLDFASFPILYFGVNNTNRKATLQNTYTLVSQKIKPEIESVAGVAAADVGGGASPQITIQLRPDQMTKYNVSPAQVAAILQANSIHMPAGDVTNNGVTEPVVTTGKLTTLSAIRNLPVTVQMPTSASSTGQASLGSQAGASSTGFSASSSQGSYPSGSGTSGSSVAQGNNARSIRTGSSLSGQGFQPVTPSSLRGQSSAAPITPRVIRLRDIATISQSQSDVNTLGTTPGQIAGIVRYNGKPAISITIRKNSDANIVQVADAVTAKVKDLEKQYPQVKIGTLLDTSTSIKTSVSDLVKDGVFGAFFAVLIIFVFLLTVRTTLVTAVSIPLSIFTAIIILGSQGISLNVMTIGAIAVAVGRVVDDAIVVLENIYRHIQTGEDRFDAVINGTREVGRAIMGSTITTVAVFLPIGFIGGILGQFFQPFAFTVTFALAASLAVALTVVPALGSLLIYKKDQPQRDTIFQRVYTPILTWALKNRAITLIAAFVVFVASLALIGIIPKGFFPASNETFAQIGVNLPAGASLGRTTALVTRIEDRVIRKQPGVSQWETIIGYDNQGAQRGGSASSSNAASMFVVYNTSTNMTKAIDRLHNALKPYQTHGVVISGAAVSNGPPSNVDVQVTGANQDYITTATRQVLSKLQGVKGLTNIQSNLQAHKPQLEIVVDPVKAFAHGLTPATAALDIRQIVTGQTVTTVRLNGQSQDAAIYVQVDPNASNTASKIKNLMIGAPAVAISKIASVTPGVGPVEISRQGQQNIGEVTADVNDNADASQVTAKVALQIAPLAKSWSAKNITVGQAGIGKQITDGFANMLIAMLIAIGTVYLIMTLLFRSLLVPFVILFALPLAVIGALIGLAVTNRQLDMSAMIGCLMLIGIVVTNAIVLLDLVQHKIEAGESVHQALIEGGRTRVRPILMTATATILALSPLAFSGSGGTLIAANLATVVIGGLLTSTLLTLVVVPVIFSWFTGMRDSVMGTNSSGISASVSTNGRAPHGTLPPERVAVSQE